MGTAPKPSREPTEIRRKMAETPIIRPFPEPDEDASQDPEQSYQELRQLILAPEQEALERLNQRVGDPTARTEDVSTVVAEAIQLRRKQGGDEALSVALAPTIETALRESVRKDPGALADALFPVMGPAIRRSILETLRSFLESFNQVLDQSLSVRGMKWRLEALRTGRTFTEVALLHSLVFRVEQAFLIHKKTGLPIGHVVASAVAMQDPSLVSGMLSAIQEFVRDSFQTTQGSGINRMNVGDLDVWIEEGPYAIVACVIRGVAPRDLRDRMSEVWENVHREYAAQLDEFTGDTAPFVKVQDELSRCLELRYKEEAKSKGYGFAYAAVGALVLLLVGWSGRSWWQYHRWEKVAATLREQPGIVITSFGREGGHYVFQGMRDPLSAEPAGFVKAAGLDPAKAAFQWASYYALDDSIVMQRAKAILNPPGSVNLSVTDGVLHVSGVATGRWVSDMLAKAPLVPGIRTLDLSREFSPEQIAFNEAKTDMENTIVMFPLGSAELSETELPKVRKAIENFGVLERAAENLREKVAIEVVGHSDSTGPEATNETLSQRRALRVSRELVQLGLPEKKLHSRGVATSEPIRVEESEASRRFNRSVSFRVNISTP